MYLYRTLFFFLLSDLRSAMTGVWVGSRETHRWKERLEELKRPGTVMY